MWIGFRSFVIAIILSFVAVTVFAQLAPTVSLSANPTSVNLGGSTTLSWTSSNAVSCVGTGFVASGTSGSVQVTPNATTSYAISCAGSPATAKSTVTVIPISADGTTIISPTGNLTTTDGKWGWGVPAANRPNESWMTLNDVQVSGVGHLMEVGNGGKLYVYDLLDDKWWLWVNGGFQLSAAPTPSIPMSMTLKPSAATALDNAPAGQVLTTASVVMSDGSVFSGAIQVSDTTGLLAVSGMNVIIARALTKADDGIHITSVSTK